MLELRSIDAGYGSFQALFGVNLDVRAGEAVGVIGPNGAGKTTLMRVISGLIRPTKGAIAMEGHDVLATPAHRIVDLGIAHVPENRRLFPRLTVEDNLKMGGFVPAARPKFRRQLEVVYELFPRMRERRHQLAGSMGAGVWHPQADALRAVREAIVKDPRGWAAARRVGLSHDEASLKRPPRGFDPEHPLIEDLKRQSFTTGAEFTQQQACAPDFAARYVAACRRAAPLMRFLARAMGITF